MQINHPEEKVQSFSMKSYHYLCTVAQSDIRQAGQYHVLS